MAFRIFLKSASLFLAFFVLTSCGSTQNSNEPQPNGDSQHVLPSGYEISESNPISADRIAVIAKKDDEFVVGLSKGKDLKSFVKISAPFKAKKVEFAQERQWGCKLGNSLGYAVSFQTDASGFDATFIKVFDENLNEIQNDLGAGFVPRELEDIDFDKSFDLVIIDLRWEGYSGVFRSQPFTQRICKFQDGKFIEDPAPYKEQFEAGKKAFMELMNKTTDQQDALYYLVCLALVYDSLGKVNEGLDGFKSMLPQFTHPDVSKNAMELLSEFSKQAENKQRLYPAAWKERQSLAWTPLPFK